jgi:2-methylcitrate dehydratase PrpD
MMGATETQLANFVATYPTDSVPPEVMHLATRCIMNYCGVALYGSLDPSLDILLGLFESEGASKQATIIGRKERTSLLNAALANGYSGHLEDYDDTHSSVIHPTSPIFPAALALSEQQTVSGKDIVAAYAIGAEVACRVGSLISNHFLEGAEAWHITNTCGVLGAASAAGRLLGLNEQQLVHALAVAGTQAMGVREVFGSMCKPFHAGKAAQNGLLTALLIQRGFTGTNNIFTGSRGFMGVMAKDYDLSELTRDLGSHWELPAVGLKPYACGAGNHALIDAMMALRTKEGVSPDTVQHIHGSLRRFAPNLIRHRHPESALDTKFSYFHAMSVALVHGTALPDQFTEEKAHEPALHSIREKIDLVEDENQPRGSVTVTMTLTDGRTYTEVIEHATGTPGNPLSDEFVENKFRALAVAVLPKDRVEPLTRMLWDIEKLDDAGKLARSLAGA